MVSVVLDKLVLPYLFAPVGVRVAIINPATGFTSATPGSEGDQPGQDRDGQQHTDLGRGGAWQDQVVTQDRAGLLLGRGQHRHDDQQEHQDDGAHWGGLGGLTFGLPIENLIGDPVPVGFSGPGYIAPPHYRRVPQPKGSKDWGTLTPVHGVMRTGCSHLQIMPSLARTNSP